jgi:hypothetical protein
MPRLDKLRIMAYVRDATVTDAPGIAAMWRAGLFAAHPGVIAADIIELPGLLGQPGRGRSAVIVFTVLRRICGGVPARSPAFVRLSGPVRMWLDAHGGLGLAAFAQARQAVLRPLTRWPQGRASA